MNCALMAPLLRVGLVGDVGSGAGLPGLVLAIARPDVTFVLIEPMERRVAWLNDQTRSWGCRTSPSFAPEPRTCDLSIRLIRSRPAQ